MANQEHVLLIQEGTEVWNRWRIENRNELPDLSGADLSTANLEAANLHSANLHDASLIFANLREANLAEANLSKANLLSANLAGARLTGANLNGAYLTSAILNGADLSKVKLGGMANFVGANLNGATLLSANFPDTYFNKANLTGANLEGANLFRSTFTQANLTGAKLAGANLTGASLVQADFTEADLTGCQIYGVSAWGLTLDRAKQNNLNITNVTSGEPEITVDNIEVAQFVYLLLHNHKIRDVIDTITSKAVLILGRFTGERKMVLEALRTELRVRGLLPILFDFLIPTSRDVTETIKVLAGLARFVIADITDATEVRVELHKIVPDFSSLPVQLILLKGRPKFVSLSHLTMFPWVLPIFEYDDQEHLLTNLDNRVVAPAENMVRRRG